MSITRLNIITIHHSRATIPSAPQGRLGSASVSCSQDILTTRDMPPPLGDNTKIKLTEWRGALSAEHTSPVMSSNPSYTPYTHTTHDINMHKISTVNVKLKTSNMKYKEANVTNEALSPTLNLPDIHIHLYSYTLSGLSDACNVLSTP